RSRLRRTRDRSLRSTSRNSATSFRRHGGTKPARCATPCASSRVWRFSCAKEVPRMAERARAQAVMPPEDECVVIGSGPGGSVTPYHLAAAGRAGTLLEDGSPPALGGAPAFSRAEMEQKYRNGGLTLAFGPARVQ